MSTDVELYQRLNTELVSLVDHFTNLVKATREGVDADEGSGGGAKERPVPGELLEVMVEKLLAAGHQCIHTVSELKKGAMISDFDTLVANVQNAGNLLYSDAHVTNRGLEFIRRDAESLLSELEQHYYGSRTKGPLPAEEHAAQSKQLAELCARALQLTGG